MNLRRRPSSSRTSAPGRKNSRSPEAKAHGWQSVLDLFGGQASTSPARRRAWLDRRLKMECLEDRALLASDTDLSITLLGGPSSVIAGTDITYNIEVDNFGPNTATAVQVTDTLPTGLIYLVDTSGDTTPTVVTAGSGLTRVDTVTLDLGDLAVGASQVFQLRAHVPADFVAATTTGTASIVNNVVASDSNADPDPDTSNNSDLQRTIVDELANIVITKIAEPSGDAPAGVHNGVMADTVTYTIYVDNLGPSAARNVFIRDTILNSNDINIQSGAFSVSQSGGGAITNFNVVTGPLVPTQFGTDIGTFSASFLMPFSLDPANPTTPIGRIRGSFRLTVNDAAEITNVTRASSSTPDPDGSNNVDSVKTKVTALADLQAFAVFGAEVQTNGLPGNIFNSNVVTPMPDPAGYNFGGTTVTAGRRIQWDGTILNAGPSAADNVHLEVLLPFGASIIENTLTGLPSPFTSVAGRAFTESAGQLRTKVIGDYGTLLSGQQARIQFLVQIDPSIPIGTQLSFDMIAKSDEPDPNPSNNIASIQFDSNAFADLAITKSDSPDPVLAGNLLTYTLTANHKGPSTAQNVQISDLTPAHTTFVSAQPSPGGSFTVDASGNVITTWAGATLPGAKRTVLLTFRVNSDTVDGTVLSNTASVTSDTLDPFLADNTLAAADTTTTHTSADLSIAKTTEIVKLNAGEQTRFQIVVTNNGPSDAQNVTAVDTLPAGLIYEVDTDSGVQGPVGTITFTLGTIPAGQSKSFEIFVLVDPNTPPNTILTNTITVASTTADPNLANNTATSRVLALRSDTDLRVTKTAPATAAPGDVITYTITVTNAGLIPATNVEVQDFVPAGMETISFALSQGNALAGVPGDPLRPTVFNLGTMAPAAVTVVTVTARVGNDQKDQTRLLNDVRVSANQKETNPADNLFHSTTTVLQSANGNVIAFVFQGSLFVTGDKYNNILRFEATPAAGVDSFRITPLGGTRLNGGFDSFQVQGAQNGVRMNLKDGNDQLFFVGPLTFEKRLEIQTGKGNDVVDMDTVTVLGNTKIYTDGGDDLIHAKDTVFGGTLDLRTGKGKDTVLLDTVSVALGSLIRNDGNDDLVTLVDSVFSGLVKLQGGSGTDTLDADPITRNNTYLLGRKIKGFEVILP